MSEEQFLKFKGLKTYSPDQGWHQLDTTARHTAVDEPAAVVSAPAVAEAPAQPLSTPQIFRPKVASVNTPTQGEPAAAPAQAPSAFATEASETARRANQLIDALQNNTSPAAQALSGHAAQSAGPQDKQTAPDSSQSLLELSNLLTELFGQLNQSTTHAQAATGASVALDAWEDVSETMTLLASKIEDREAIHKKLGEMDLEIDRIRAHLVAQVEEVQQVEQKQLSMARIRNRLASFVTRQLVTKLGQPQNH